jgi:hypothetical protein
MSFKIMPDRACKMRARGQPVHCGLRLLQAWPGLQTRGLDCWLSPKTRPARARAWVSSGPILKCQFKNHARQLVDLPGRSDDGRQPEAAGNGRKQPEMTLHQFGAKFNTKVLSSYYAGYVNRYLEEDPGSLFWYLKKYFRRKI